MAGISSGALSPADPKDHFPICLTATNKTYYALVVKNSVGAFLSGSYVDENNVLQNLVAGTFTYGACTIGGPSYTKKFVVTQSLSAGPNLILHNLALSDANAVIEVRSAATGEIINHTTSAYGANSVTITVPVAVASARITIIG